MLIQAIWKERFKKMLPINLSFPKFSIISALVNYYKLPIVLAFMIILYIMSVKWFLCSSFLSFERFVSTFMIIQPHTKFCLRFAFRLQFNGPLLILNVSSVATGPKLSVFTINWQTWWFLFPHGSLAKVLLRIESQALTK